MKGSILALNFCRPHIITLLMMTSMDLVTSHKNEKIALSLHPLIHHSDHHSSDDDLDDE
jgi:hypothetical protein